MARSAATILRSADLAEEFGRNLAVRWFGEEAVDSLPLRMAGKNKGKPKGVLCWLSTTEAGYHVNAGGGVAANTVVRAWVGTGPFSPESSALSGMWLGRMQSLCGSRCLLSAAAREQDAAERARDAARFRDEVA